MDRKRKKHHIRLVILALAVSGIIFFFLGAMFWGVYRFDRESNFIAFAEKIIPFPALYINGAGAISIGEMKENTKAVKKFYESQDFEQIGMRVDFSTEQGRKRLKIKEKEILNKMIENKIIEKLSKEKGIIVSESIVDQEINSKIDQFGNRQNLMSELARLYGWSLLDFKEKVVKPDLYAEKLSEAYYENLDTSQERTKIQSLYERVTEKKEDFSKVAQEASEGESSKNGGDLGWSSKNQLIPEIEEKAFSMKVGEISEVIASPLGFHIIKLEEKKAEDGEDLVHLRQIFVKITTFGDWLKSEMKNRRVTVFLKDYQWNQEEGKIEFANADLRQFEENLDINSPGDPSVFP